MEPLRDVVHHLELQVLWKLPAQAGIATGYRWGHFGDKGLLQSLLREGSTNK